jgi:hypothetical protein
MKKLFILLFLIFSTAAFADSPVIPNARLTPGMIDPNATVEKVCTPGYSKSVRRVTSYTKKQVFTEYNIDRNSDIFEVDHLISLSLGGSNSLYNLWPQSYTTKPFNAIMKDRLELRLHSLVCSGKLDLRTAQYMIAKDWISAYNLYMKRGS